MKEFVYWLKNLLNTSKKNALEFCTKIKKLACKTRNWVGIDGLLNMQASIILVIFFSIFFSDLTSAILALTVAVIKMCHDKLYVHENECHDFVCCIVGIIIGMFISSYVGIALFVI